MFVGYVKHTNHFRNARVATLMIDKLLQKFRRQLESFDYEITNQNKDNMENKHFVMSVTDIAMVPETDYCRITGCAKSGTMHIETEIALSTGRRGFVVEILKDGQNVQSASKGETISLMVLNLEERDLQSLPNDLYAEAVDDFYENRLSQELIDHNRNVQILDVPPTTDELDLPFKMVVDGIYWIEAKKGYLVSGKIVGGGVSPDDKVILSNGMKATVKEFDNGEDYACAFDSKVGILLSDIKKGALDGVTDLVITMK